MATVTESLGWIPAIANGGESPIVRTVGDYPGPDAAETLIRTLYAEHGRSLLAYATRLTGDRAAAEDVVQETLVRAWKHAGDLTEGKGSVRGWLLTVATNGSVVEAEKLTIRSVDSLRRTVTAVEVGA